MQNTLCVGGFMSVVIVVIGKSYPRYYYLLRETTKVVQLFWSCCLGMRVWEQACFIHALVFLGPDCGPCSARLAQACIDMFSLRTHLWFCRAVLHISQQLASFVGWVNIVPCARPWKAAPSYLRFDACCIML